MTAYLVFRSLFSRDVQRSEKNKGFSPWRNSAHEQPFIYELTILITVQDLPGAE